MPDDGPEMDSPEYWIQSQQTEIDSALEDIGDRRTQLTGRLQDGILDGDALQNHGNERLEAYLQGYADALGFAAGRVESIDNVVKYAVEHINSDASDGDEGGE